MAQKKFLSSNISNLRDSADILFDLGKFESAYGLYDEVYRQLWLTIGLVQNRLSNFSQNFLELDFKNSWDFKNNFTAAATNTAFINNFGMNENETLNEFIYSIYGKQQCVLSSTKLIAEIQHEFILTEYLLLYTLITKVESDEWANHILKIYNPIIEGSRLKTIYQKISGKYLKVRLAEEAEIIKSTTWSALNHNMLEFLLKSKYDDEVFIKMISAIAGPFTSQSKRKYRKGKTSGNSNYDESYKKYERYERYEKYERFEKYEKSYSKQNSEFDFDSISEEEKTKFFGSLFGLKGQVTKSQIRKKYLELIAKYHPDKVSDLGPELITLAENKSKQINQAYEWFKKKYDL